MHNHRPMNVYVFLIASLMNVNSFEYVNSFNILLNSSSTFNKIDTNSKLCINIYKKYVNLKYKGLVIDGYKLLNGYTILY